MVDRETNTTMRNLTIFLYYAFLVLAAYNSIIDNYDEACFDLLLAYGIRWHVKDEY